LELTSSSKGGAGILLKHSAVEQIAPNAEECLSRHAIQGCCCGDEVVGACLAGILHIKNFHEFSHFQPKEYIL
jgi:hypothetical protein